MTDRSKKENPVYSRTGTDKVELKEDEWKNIDHFDDVNGEDGFKLF